MREPLARRRIPRTVFDFIDGGAEDEITLRENRAAFERLRLVPRVWISNHGGRQLDGALASADAPGPIAAALGGKLAVLVDSGVRRGVDILKAMARGADAAAIARPVLFGACVAGEAGARRALEILIEELRLAMKLSGTPSLAQADRELVAA